LVISSLVILSLVISPLVIPYASFLDSRPADPDFARGFVFSATQPAVGALAPEHKDAKIKKFFFVFFVSLCEDHPGCASAVLW
jgi:hypothetical protein